jgi:hypothetical protein
MKPGYLVAAALLGTLGFGYWIVAFGRGEREIWIALGGWLLGFWLASGIRGSMAEAGAEADEETEWEEEDEEWEEEER